MTNRLLHTPDGARDMFGEECAKRRVVEGELQSVFHMYGYQSISTPSFEFFDIFSKERGSVTSQEMFKFFDRDNNTLVLRPDMTPAIARCAAKFFMDETIPIRLSYLEQTFINHASYKGRFKEVTQTGAELIGDDSSDSDAEMLVMVVDALKAAGLKEFQVEVGQVEFFRGLVEEAGMDQDVQEQLRDMIENKNDFGVEELVRQLSISEPLKRAFLHLPRLYGSMEQIRKVREWVTNPRALRAIDRLEKIQAIVEQYKAGDHISYDLGMLSKYQYYTGVIFRAYTYGTGDYIVTGGRYDKLLLQFGKDAPAVGFAIVIDQLMLALSRQKIPVAVSMVNTIILYDRPAQARGIRLAVHLRGLGMPVQLIRKSSRQEIGDYCSFAAKSSMRNLLYLKEDGKTVYAMDIINGKTDQFPFEEYFAG